jgi:hypothetical protein
MEQRNEIIRIFAKIKSGIGRIVRGVPRLWRRRDFHRVQANSIPLD